MQSLWWGQMGQIIVWSHAMAKLHIERVIALANAELESRQSDVGEQHDNYTVDEIEIESRPTQLPTAPQVTALDAAQRKSQMQVEQPCARALVALR
jgi:hypothetical protein